MAEMTALTAAIYRKYQTNLASTFKDASPGITARFEMFYDERFPTIKVSVVQPFFLSPPRKDRWLTRARYAIGASLFDPVSEARYIALWRSARNKSETQSSIMVPCRRALLIVHVS
jgi:hypothetical protein